MNNTTYYFPEDCPVSLPPLSCPPCGPDRGATWYFGVISLAVLIGTLAEGGLDWLWRHWGWIQAERVLKWCSEWDLLSYSLVR